MSNRHNDDEPSYTPILCLTCGTEITCTQNISAERFQGRLGPATLYKTAINAMVMSTEHRDLLSGSYDVADVACRNCQTKLGWYYYRVSNESNEWKIGKYCLEDTLTTSDASKVVKKNAFVVSSNTSNPLTFAKKIVNAASPAAIVNAVVGVRNVEEDEEEIVRKKKNDDDANREESDDDDEENEKGYSSESADDEDDDDVSDEEEQQTTNDIEENDEWEVVELIEMEA